MWLVDLKYNFKCDWLVELSDNKLSDKNSAGELVELNMSFLTTYKRGNCNLYDDDNNNNNNNNNNIAEWNDRD